MEIKKINLKKLQFCFQKKKNQQKSVSQQNSEKLLIY